MFCANSFLNINLYLWVRCLRFSLKWQPPKNTFCTCCMCQVETGNLLQQTFVCTEYISEYLWSRTLLPLFSLGDWIGINSKCWTKAPNVSLGNELWSHNISHLLKRTLNIHLFPPQSIQHVLELTSVLVSPTFLVRLSSLNPSRLSACTSLWSSPVSS